MQNSLLKELINFVYSKKDNVLFSNIMLSDLSSENIQMLDGFHMQEVYMLEANDDYFCGIRANHFCIEFGESEICEPNTEKCDKLILITANHKGNRGMTLLKLN